MILRHEYLYIFYITSGWYCFSLELIYGLQIIANFKILYFWLFNEISYNHRWTASLIEHVHNLEFYLFILLNNIVADF